jgi:hypothetical protein
MLLSHKSEKEVNGFDSRVLKTFEPTDNRWNFEPGDYGVFVGGSSDNTPITGSLVVR